MQKLIIIIINCIFCLCQTRMKQHGYEVEMNHVHRKPLLWFRDCHKWNGEWMLYALIYITPKLEEVLLTLWPEAEHCLCFTGGFLFCFVGDLTHASPRLDFESHYTFDAYLLRAVNLLNLLKVKNTPLLYITCKCEYISFLCTEVFEMNWVWHIHVANINLFWHARFINKVQYVIHAILFGSLLGATTAIFRIFFLFNVKWPTHWPDATLDVYLPWALNHWPIENTLLFT